MALYKDGKVYRTYEEQVDHLTKKHLEQNLFNANVSKTLQELTVASNLGGYNLVRYAFSSDKSFSISECNIKQTEDLEYLVVGEFVVFNSFNSDDIPAYGIVNEDKTISLIFNGDYAEERLVLKCCSNSTNTRVDFDVIMEYGNATSLLSLNANDHKKQVFTVLHDLSYGCRTQYVSHDVNGDGRYEFVYIGVDQNGKDGRSIYSVNNDNYDSIKSTLRTGDLIIASSSIPSIINYETKVSGVSTGDVLEFVAGNEFIFKCSIIGPTGPRGLQGEKGQQGIQGVQGVQGIQGEKGERGEKGKDGDGLDIKSGILSSPSQLPSFNLAEVGDAYRIINTSGGYVTYDLYFKASNGVDWDIQPNWGGVQGPKGDKGDTGLQGVQGIQGEQGEKGESGLTGKVFVIDKYWLRKNNVSSLNDFLLYNLNALLEAEGVNRSPTQTDDCTTDASKYLVKIELLEFDAYGLTLNFYGEDFSNVFYASFDISYYYSEDAEWHQVFIKQKIIQNGAVLTERCATFIGSLNNLSDIITITEDVSERPEARLVVTIVPYYSDF